MHDLVVRDLERATDRTLGLTDVDEPTLVAQQEELWLLRGGDQARPGMLPPDVDALYDAFKHPRAERPPLPLLPRVEARANHRHPMGRHPQHPAHRRRRCRRERAL